MNVEIALFDGFDELDAIGPFEVFANAGRLGGDCEVALVTTEGARMVEASHGLRVEADATVGDTGPDLLVVPGGGWNATDGPGVRSEANSGPLPAQIAKMHDRGITVASVCTGAMLLARDGLLDGIPATTHHTAMADLREVADVREARVVDAGDLLTAGGVTSGLDLAFHVVRDAFGDEVADDVAREMEYEPSDDVLDV